MTEPAREIAKLEAGTDVLAIIPRTIEECYRYSLSLVAAGAIPSALKGRNDEETKARVTTVMLAGLEYGFPPMQSMRMIGLINNAPYLYGDGLPAVVGRFKQVTDIHVLEAIAPDSGVKLSDWPDDIFAEAVVKRRDRKSATIRRFSVADAKRAGLWNGKDPWKKYPTRMLTMRARAWAIRDACADLMTIGPTYEEMEPAMRDITPREADASLLDDEPTVTPPAEVLPPEGAEGIAEPDQAEPVPDHQEPVEAPVEPSEDPSPAREKGETNHNIEKLKKYLFHDMKNATTALDAQVIVERAAFWLTPLADSDPELYGKIDSYINKRMAELGEPEMDFD